MPPLLPFSFCEEVDWLSLEKIADSGQCFRWSQCDGGGFIIPASGHLAFMSQKDGQLFVDHDGPSDSFWKIYLDLETDYRSVAAQMLGLPHMKDCLSFGEGLRVLNQPFFETSVSYIISQNNNITRIKNLVRELSGGSRETFPDATTLISRIQNGFVGLGYRDKYILAFCERYLNGDFSVLEQSTPFSGNETPSLSVAHDILLSTTGIGDKVASCIELYSLGIHEAIPRDVWIKRAEENYGIVWHPQLAGIQQLFVFYAIRNGILD